MDVYTMVVIIVIVSCLAGVANRFVKMKQQQAEHNEPDDVTTARLEDLEDRIEVLEKIVTDDKRTLEREIGDL